MKVFLFAALGFFLGTVLALAFAALAAIVIAPFGIDIKQAGIIYPLFCLMVAINIYGGYRGFAYAMGR
ncbi:hypothetical protein BOSEA31B_14164 [Hyphomicrobiales bacterium]|jgi:hypothetical protein|nr:hypothetical protein BOSEA31B_14164 [Hyphomicrobiales bacterium]CAH1699941.1 hypothetical protein BOSEA1005_12994 [Hyphomicrobiales bacterium]CAI0343700.1 hypothetical protein BO1005MUT1_290036 [Hyphomicrobiales bacterium]